MTKSKTAGKRFGKTPKKRKAPAAPIDLAGIRWTDWRKLLKKRAQTHGAGEVFPKSATPPLLWSPVDASIEKRVRCLDSLAQRRNGKYSSEEVLDAIGDSETQFSPIEHVARGYYLAELAGFLAEDQWKTQFDLLRQLVRDAAEINLESTPLDHQLLGVELPLALAWRLGDVDGCEDYPIQAAAAMQQGVSELTDENGMPHRTCFGQLSGLLACWTRSMLLSHLLAKRAAVGGSQGEVRRRFARLVEQVMRMIRCDGTFPFEPSPNESKSTRIARRDLLSAASHCTEDAELFRAVESSLDRSVAPKHDLTSRQKRKTSELPRTARRSEECQVGVMRSRWKRGSEILTVVYDQHQLLIDLQRGQQTIFSGPATPSVTVNGEPLQPAAPWEEVCWHTDDDVHYLELETTLIDSRGAKWKLQRQHLLARDDRFVFLADAVIGDSSIGKEQSKIELHTEFPLSPQLNFEPARETHEGRLTVAEPESDENPVLVLPLAFPEWRSEPSSGVLEMTSVEGTPNLAHTVSCHGIRLYAPLFLSLRRKNPAQEVTWRQLTVAEGLEIQPGQTAVGYRVQLGRRQWLFYRSLAPSGNRTVLGHNLSTEFLAARFPKNGVADPLLEIE